ncbi:MAG: sulfite exporter TauE/SafE family protein [Xanthobacteraceae bacterium]|nr:sulfite exporter TauE/SafE family protein [Xanthobacteraceae bacterium]
MAVSILAGVVRGFSGFGSALIFVPLMSAIYDPRIAAGTFLLIDFAVGLAVLPTIGREAHWRDVFPLAAAAVVAAQFGALILIYTDPTILRWAIAIVVLVLLAVLMSGWRYHGRPRMRVTLGVGALAGTLGGAIQIVGPPVIVYWLGSSWSPTVIRANLNAFFGVFACALFVTYVARGLLPSQVIILALLLGPLQVLALKGGALMFRGSSAQTYRRAAYAIVAVSALVSMPIWDHFFR